MSQCVAEFRPDVPATATPQEMTKGCAGNAAQSVGVAKRASDSNNVPGTNEAARASRLDICVVQPDEDDTHLPWPKLSVQEHKCVGVQLKPTRVGTLSTRAPVMTQSEGGEGGGETPDTDLLRRRSDDQPSANRCVLNQDNDHSEVPTPYSPTHNPIFINFVCNKHLCD